jgi:L-lactate dehydrogenase complex protein LldG
MTAREAILKAIRDARPAARALPATIAGHDAGSPSHDSLVVSFVSASRAAGAEVVEVAPSETAAAIRAIRANAELGVVICEALLGVAENGAVWLPLSRLGDRAATFLADRVVIVLDRESIVSDMHRAYEQIDPRAEAFGTFMAGPSKTADVEQSLVIGAHGPRRVTVVLRG